MSLLEHLAELRNRIAISLLAILAGAVLAYIYKDWIYGGLLRPLLLEQPELKLNFFAPTEPFFVYMRIALFGGITLASPFVLYQLWAFVAPGLTPKERSTARPTILMILLLFACGVCFVYFMLLPASLGILIGMANPGMEAELGQDRYFSFVIGLCLAGGVLFELPVVLGLLGWLGIVDARWLWKQSAAAFLALLILAAVITPTGDAFTMLVLTIPLMALYWLSIVLVWLIRRSGGNIVST
jgi:sec-independent protein translocase protein TatC